MNTDEKLSHLIDKLLVKTQENLCNWKRDKNNKYFFTTPIGNVEIYYAETFIGGSNSINFEIKRDDISIIGMFQHEKESNSNLVRLYNAVVKHHKNYVDAFLTNILNELEKK